jgi:hypothetical protein
VASWQLEILPRIAASRCARQQSLAHEIMRDNGRAAVYLMRKRRSHPEPSDVLALFTSSTSIRKAKNESCYVSDNYFAEHQASRRHQPKKRGFGRSVSGTIPRSTALVFDSFGSLIDQ